MTHNLNRKPVRPGCRVDGLSPVTARLTPRAHRFWLVLCAIIAGLFASITAYADSSPATGGATSSAHDWRQKYADYRSLPSSLRARMRQLDQDLQSSDAETQARLMRVMRRYNEWLQRLPENERQLIASAPSGEERLKQVRRIRERQWIATLPKADRDKVAEAATPEARQSVISGLHKQQEARDLEWHLVQERQEERAAAFRWLQNDMSNWVQKELAPKLTPEEKQRLDRSRRSLLQYTTVIELAKKHEIALPGPLQELDKMRSRFSWPRFPRSRTPAK